MKIIRDFANNKDQYTRTDGEDGASWAKDVTTTETFDATIEGLTAFIKDQTAEIANLQSQIDEVKALRKDARAMRKEILDNQPTP